MTDDNMKLKPCPFCGGPAELVKSRLPDGKTCYKVGYVRCKKCYARSGEQSLDGYYGAPIATDQEIRELWNRRAENEQKPMPI